MRFLFRDFFTLVFCLLMMTGLACRRPPLPTVDLIASSFVADVRFERIGETLMTHENDPNLRNGWSAPTQQSDGSSHVWAIGMSSEIAFHLNHSRPLMLRMVARSANYPGMPNPQMKISVNGFPVATVQLLTSEPGRYELALSEQALRQGENLLRFDHPWGNNGGVDRGEDFRPLAVLYSELAVVTTGSPMPAELAATAPAALPVSPLFTYAENWGEVESIPDPGPFRWALGQSAECAFTITTADRGIEFTFHALPFHPSGHPPQDLTWILNGHPLKTLPLRDGWNASIIVLPQQFLVPGVNRMMMKAQYAISPGDARKGEDSRVLSIAIANPLLSWMVDTGVQPFPSGELLNQGNAMVQPAGSELAYTLKVTRPGRLQMAGKPSAPARITVRCSTDANPVSKTIFDKQVKEPLDITLKLCGRTGETAEISITVDAAGGAAGKSFNAFTYDKLLLRGQDNLVDLPNGNVPAPLSTVAKRPRTILIYLVDTLRPDHLSAYGYSRPTSPRLNAFSRTAERFTNAFAVTSWTKPATAAVLTGLPPELNGTGYELSPLRADVSYLPALMKPLGYRSAAIVTNPFVGPDFNFQRDFDDFFLIYDEKRSNISSVDANRKLSAILAQTPADQSLLVYMHTFDPHSPYEPVPAFNPFRRDSTVEKYGTQDEIKAGRKLMPFGKFPAATLETMRDLYDGEILQADDSFGAALDLLDKAGRGDDAVVVFLSDHGEEFGEHGGLEHGQTLFGEVTRIPLLIRWPDGHGGGVVRPEAVSQLDILPTILDAVGAPTSGLPGRSLRAPIPARTLVSSLNYELMSQVCILEGHWKYCRSNKRLSGQFLGKPMEYLFNLESDSMEEKNLAAAQPYRTALLRTVSRMMQIGESVNMTGEVDAETVKKLKALGYLGN